MAVGTALAIGSGLGKLFSGLFAGGPSEEEKRATQGIIDRGNEAFDRDLATVRELTSSFSPEEFMSSLTAEEAALIGNIQPGLTGNITAPVISTNPDIMGSFNREGSSSYNRALQDVSDASFLDAITNVFGEVGRKGQALSSEADFNRALDKAFISSMSRYIPTDRTPSAASQAFSIGSDILGGAGDIYRSQERSKLIDEILKGKKK